jgi:hypothetical protein
MAKNILYASVVSIFAIMLIVLIVDVRLVGFAVLENTGHLYTGLPLRLDFNEDVYKIMFYPFSDQDGANFSLDKVDMQVPYNAIDVFNFSSSAYLYKIDIYFRTNTSVAENTVFLAEYLNDNWTLNKPLKIGSNDTYNYYLSNANSGTFAIISGDYPTFSNYVESCRNGYCGEGESCTSCPFDCGACTSETPQVSAPVDASVSIETPKQQLPFIWIIFFASLFTFLGAGAWFVYSQRGRLFAKPANPQVQTYVSKAIKEGRTPDQIKYALTVAGWPESEINLAFEHVK